jgi:hypothetical protein
MGAQLVMVAVMSNGRVYAYQNIVGFPLSEKERFRFKVVESQAMRKNVGLHEID